MLSLESASHHILCSVECTSHKSHVYRSLKLYPMSFCGVRDILYFHITFVDIYLQIAILFRCVWRFQKQLYSQSRQQGFRCFFNDKTFVYNGRIL
jgi:hypothetical protein